jgi:hypothetical protein
MFTQLLCSDFLMTILECLVRAIVVYTTVIIVRLSDEEDVIDQGLKTGRCDVP